MAIRPVDLQQVVIKAPDVTRDAAAQQAAASAQQAQTAEHTNRRAQQAETVEQFDEAGTVLIRERQARGEQDQEQAADDQQAQEDDAVADGVLGKGPAPQPRLGRHIDLQA